MSQSYVMRLNIQGEGNLLLRWLDEKRLSTRRFIVRTALVDRHGASVPTTH